MKLINANIKSKKELAQRLIEGEVFYTHAGNKVFYDGAMCNPFRWEGWVLNEIWEDFRPLQKKVSWQEEIPEQGVLCWVGDKGGVNMVVATIIITFSELEEFSYKSIDDRWKYATPLTNEEVEKYVL